MQANQSPVASERPLHYQLRCPGLPLAVYREVAAHLRQVEGIEVELLRQQSQQFDYHHSQIGGLWVHHTIDDAAAYQRVEQILAYYGSRYGSWEALKT